MSRSQVRATLLNCGIGWTTIEGAPPVLSCPLVVFSMVEVVEVEEVVLWAGKVPDMVCNRGMS